MSLTVWVMNADGSGATPLPNDPKRVFHELAWSPDSRKIAGVSQLFDLDKDKQIKYLAHNIWVMNADGSGSMPLTRFTNPSTYIDGITWSPDGRKIAFLSNRPLDGDDEKKPDIINRNIWVINADGSNAMPLTRFTGRNSIFELKWTPDSRNLSYVSRRALDGSDANTSAYNIWLTKTDGSGSHPLTQFRNASCRTFSWSPDGTHLSFSTNASLNGGDVTIGGSNIWVMRADGSAPVPLTTAIAFESRNDYPEWSPDGSLIAFASCIDSTSAKPRSSSYCAPWVTKVDGTGARQLSEQNVGRLAWHPSGS